MKLDRLIGLLSALAVIAGALLYAVGHRQLGCTIGFCGLGVSCAAWSWRDPHLPAVGTAIACANIASLFAYYALAVHERPIAMTVAELLVTSSAYLARVTGGPRGLIVIAAASAAAATGNVWFSHLETYTPSQLRAYTIAENLCYVVECLALHVTLLVARVRQADRPRRTGDHLVHAAPHADVRRQESDR